MSDKPCKRYLPESLGPVDMGLVFTGYRRQAACPCIAARHPED